MDPVKSFPKKLSNLARRFRLLLRIREAHQRYHSQVMSGGPPKNPYGTHRLLAATGSRSIPC